jgi:hypothetical protein
MQNLLNILVLSLISFSIGCSDGEDTTEAVASIGAVENVEGNKKFAFYAEDMPGDSFETGSAEPVDRFETGSADYADKAPMPTVLPRNGEEELLHEYPEIANDEEPLNVREKHSTITKEVLLTDDEVLEVDDYAGQDPENFEPSDTTVYADEDLENFEPSDTTVFDVGKCWALVSVVVAGILAGRRVGHPTLLPAKIPFL